MCYVRDTCIGQLSQPKRLGALNKFKAGDRNILVATGKPPFTLLAFTYYLLSYLVSY